MRSKREINVDLITMDRSVQKRLMNKARAEYRIGKRK